MNAMPYLKWLLAAGLLVSGLAGPSHAQSAQVCRPSDVAGFNHVLGTQAIGGNYKFSDDNSLTEQVRELNGLGSNVLKISLAEGAAERYGSLDAAKRARSTLEYLKASSTLQQALDRDFTYYQFWVHSFTKGTWHDGVGKAEAKAYYDEIYELSTWLLTRYSGTGKVFMLGNWEGDWLLTGRRNRDAAPSPKAIEGMIAWLNIRQKAVDDAKATIPHQDVQLYHYVEVNLVKKAMNGQPSVASSVLQLTNVDLVSYSSYEAIKQSQKPDLDSIRQPLTATLAYLEGQLQPKPGLPFSRRVFLGEYGYHADKSKPLTVKQQYMKSRFVMQVAIELDLPFALIWQLYNNEYAPDGTSKEMSLIDESGQKRALYYLHQRYLSDMQAFVSDSCRQTGSLPARDAFKAKALSFLMSMPFERAQKLADNQFSSQPNPAGE